MLLPKKITRKYTYNENDVFFKTYSTDEIDKLIADLFMKNGYLTYVNIKTSLSFRNSPIIKHTLETESFKRNISDEEYKKYLKICFFKLRYHILNIVEKIDKDSNLSYEFELCTLIRKQNKQSKTLRKVMYK